MWALILHGGAKEIEPDKADASRAGCKAALVAGLDILVQGGSAIDAVEAALRVLEDDPTFNCGFGSALHEAGQVEMCSGIMNGATFDVGAVSVIEGVRHPISVAKAMLSEEVILLSGPGARKFAADNGQELCDPADLIVGERPGAHDTVGCVALDSHGLLVAGTSTGGLDGTKVGRVGDAPMPGCGYYADNAVGAVALSGDGEHIARMMLAARIMRGLEHGDPDSAIQTALAQLTMIGGEAGAIALTPDGRFGWMHTSRDFVVAMASSAAPEPHVYLNQTESTR